MIPDDYMQNRELLKGAMVVESCANGKNEEGFRGNSSLTKEDGSFHRDALPSGDVLRRFLNDGYIEPVPNQSGWFRRVAVNKS